MKPTERPVTRVAYFMSCKECGKEGEVHKSTTNHVCWICRQKLAKEQARAEQAHLLGATVVEMAMNYIEEFESITVKTTDGRLFMFTAGGWEDEHYIEVADVTNVEGTP